MKTIILTHGTIAFVDDEDYVLVSDFSWYESKRRTVSYACAYTGGGRRNAIHSYLHRLVMRAKPGDQVDHINGNGLDCQKSNLRFVTTTQNRRNQQKARSTSSIYKGVRCRKSSWEAFITVNHHYRYLGVFDSEVDAAAAYNGAAIEFFGEFARLNVLP